MKLFKRITSIHIFYSLSKWQIKFILGIVAFTIFAGLLLYTQTIVDELIEREQKTIKLYAEFYQKYSNPNRGANSIEDYIFWMDKITPTIYFPIIFTDTNDRPLYPFEDYTLNIEIDTTLNIEKKREILNQYIVKMGKSFTPIRIEDANGKLLHKFYYTNSALIDRLRYFPFIEILIVAIFIFIGYIAFNNIRSNEETKVWVGMAKEAAHQLGTPLSSLLAWAEILKNNKDNPDYIEETVNEMESDINRLNTIATRFSKIGSKPEMKPENLAMIIELICQYFEKRLPHLGRHIEIIRNLDENIVTNINYELFQWVIENLLKNAAEAIEHKKGTVIIDLKLHHSKKIIITITDNGKGMTTRQKRQIFFPGYTTKKRGWGLGLSLCLRIVEDYHNGRIYVKDTAPGKGSTFVIEIPSYQKKLS